MVIPTQWRFPPCGGGAEAEVETWQICVVAVQALVIISSSVAFLHATKSLIKPILETGIESTTRQSEC